MEWKICLRYFYIQKNCQDLDRLNCLKVNILWFKDLEICDLHSHLTHLWYPSPSLWENDLLHILPSVNNLYEVLLCDLRELHIWLKHDNAAQLCKIWLQIFFSAKCFESNFRKAEADAELKGSPVVQRTDIEFIIVFFDSE